MSRSSNLLKQPTINQTNQWADGKTKVLREKPLKTKKKTITTKTQAQDVESEPWVVRTLAYFKQSNTNQHSPK